MGNSPQDTFDTDAIDYTWRNYRRHATLIQALMQPHRPRGGFYTGNIAFHPDLLEALGLQQVVLKDGQSVAQKAGKASLANHLQSFGRYLSHDRDVYGIEPMYVDHGDGMGTWFRFTS